MGYVHLNDLKHLNKPLTRSDVFHEGVHIRAGALG